MENNKIQDRENGKEKQNLSIRSSIILLFLISLITSVIVIGLVVFTNWINAAKERTQIIAYDMNKEISGQINQMLGAPYNINMINQRIIGNNIIDLQNSLERDAFFAGVLKTQGKDIYSFSYGTETGEYYGARRNENGSLEIMKNNKATSGQTWYYSANDNLTAGQIVMKTGTFDVRTRDWYKVTKEKGKPVYSAVYKHFVMDDLTISASWPVFDLKGNLKGVLGAHMLLSDVDENLNKIVSEKHGFSYIIEKESEELIGNSFQEKNYEVQADGKINRINLTNVRNEIMNSIYEKYKRCLENNFVYEGGSERYHVNINEYQKEGLSWIIISALPEDIFMDEIEENIFTTVLIVLAMMVISGTLYYRIMKKMFRPITTLIESMERFSSKKKLERVAITRNDEIGIISKMYNQMANRMNYLVNNLETIVQERTLELKNTNVELINAKKDLYLILDSTAEGIFGLDTEGNCTFCNNQCLELLGYQHQNELIGKNMHYQIHHSNRSGNRVPVEECRILSTILKGERIYSNDEVFWRADGSSFDVEYNSYPQIRDEKVIGAVVTFNDITERRKIQQQIEYLSCHDSLTGLMNRRCFESTLDKYDDKEYLPISIIFADLNGLKLVNDIFGHEAGDLLIKKAAGILRKTCRSVDVIARVGGDEFIVLLPRTKAEDAETIIERVQTALSKEDINGIRLSMALGYDTKTSVFQDIEKTMGYAESEMYKEKSRSRKNFGVETLNKIIESYHLRSPREKEHAQNVAKLCYQMGQMLNLTETKSKKLQDAGYLHDIGKIVLDDRVLLQDKNLTGDDIQMMKEHSVIGYRILNLFDDTLNLAEAVYAHHERWDGTGYPKGLKGTEIPLTSRVIAIAENFERNLSLSKGPDSERLEKALEQLRQESGKVFDPELVTLFIKMVTES